MKELKKINLCGKEVFPLFEGGRGVNVSNGETAGAWAKELQTHRSGNYIFHGIRICGFGMLDDFRTQYVYYFSCGLCTYFSRCYTVTA